MSAEPGWARRELEESRLEIEALRTFERAAARVPTNVDLFLDEVRRELTRAQMKHPNEEGVLTDAEWLAVLTEEVGEAARAIQDEDDEFLRAELVQVAAMAMRWAVSIPHGRVRPPWAGRGSK